MTITFHNPVWVGPNRRRVAWESSLEDPVYWLYLNGDELGQTRTNHLVIGADNVLDVFDAEPGPVEVIAGEERAVLTFDGVSGAAQYKIEQEVGEEWIDRGRVAATAADHYEWTTPALTEGAAHNFRVTPLGSNGNAGTPTTVAVTIARHPAVPVVDYAFSDVTKKVTITAG